MVAVGCPSGVDILNKKTHFEAQSGNTRPVHASRLQVVRNKFETPMQGVGKRQKHHLGCTFSTAGNPHRFKSREMYRLVTQQTIGAYLRSPYSAAPSGIQGLTAAPWASPTSHPATVR